MWTSRKTTAQPRRPDRCAKLRLKRTPSWPSMRFGLIKQGKKSVDVKRQYTGTSGKVVSCQIGVFLSWQTSQGHALIDRALYLPPRSGPGTWSGGARPVCPEEVTFATKPWRARCSSGCWRREHARRGWWHAGGKGSHRLLGDCQPLFGGNRCQRPPPGNAWRGWRCRAGAPAADPRGRAGGRRPAPRAEATDGEAVRAARGNRPLTWRILEEADS